MRGCSLLSLPGYQGWGMRSFLKLNVAVTRRCSLAWGGGMRGTAEEESLSCCPLGDLGAESLQSSSLLGLMRPLLASWCSGLRGCAPVPRSCHCCFDASIACCCLIFFHLISSWLSVLSDVFLHLNDLVALHSSSRVLKAGRRREGKEERAGKTVATSDAIWNVSSLCDLQRKGEKTLWKKYLVFSNTDWEPGYVL